MQVTGLDPATHRPLTVTVTDGRITTVSPGPPEAAADCYLAPGLVDLQVNGFHGYDVNADDITPDTIAGLVHELRREGVTTFCPTVITASEEKITHALRTIAAVRRADPLIAHAIPRLHVEGPHISDQDGPRGVHPSEHVRPPDLREFQRWQDASGGLVGMVTFSPHYPASLDYTAALTALGVHVAIGHTHAAPAEIRAAVDAGASFSTHLGNGCHASLPRHPNYIWAQLAEDRLTAGLPADGHHLPADTFIAMLRAKGLQRVVLVSDSVALAGMPSGRYRTAVGDHVDLTEDGRLVQAGTGHLAGAACSLADGVVRAVGMARITLGDAVRLATSNPGRYVGDRGVLRPGTSGDVIQFRWSPDDTRLDIQAVLVAGAAG